jgi:hypothetical protein
LGISVARNITSSKTKGIGSWSDEEIKRAITVGTSKDGSKLKPPMGYQYYATMTADDVDAVVAYCELCPRLTRLAAGTGKAATLQLGAIEAYISAFPRSSCPACSGHPRLAFWPWMAGTSLVMTK